MPHAVRQLLDLMTRRERAEFYLLVLVLIVVAAFELAGIASVMPFLAVVTSPEVIRTNRWLHLTYDLLDFQGEKQFLLFLGGVVLGLLVMGNTIKACSSWMIHRYCNKLHYLLGRRLLAHYMARPYSFFLNRNTAELGKNILTESRNVIIGALSPMTTIVSSALVSIAIMTLLIVVDPVVAMSIAFVLGGAYTLVYVFARRKLGSIGRQQVEANFQKQRLAGEALSGIKDLKILGRELTFLRRFAVFAKQQADNNVIAGVIADLPRYLLEVVAFGGILAVVLYLIGTGRQAAQLVPLLALYAFAGYRLMPALQQLFAAVSALRIGVASLNALHRDLVASVDSRQFSEADLVAPESVAPLPFRRQLEFRNVSFQYEEAPARTLRHISLTIPANTTVGLVGPTGSGKTTAVDLLLGLLAPDEGQLVVDGIEINASNAMGWRANLGYVPQQIFISDDTVARNIAFGVPDDQIDMAAVHRAAEIANIAQFVQSELPRGFHTEIGERGIRLSGGQRQRLGIARALYRDPSVLVLDEATSALDTITEESVMDAVRRLSKQKTMIVIAHRLSTVKECHAIYLLDRGSVVSAGTYEELLRTSDWFRTAAGDTNST